MSRKELFEKVSMEQIIGVVREESIDAAESVAEAFARNGIRILEVTLTTPEAFDLIARFAQKYATLAVPELVRTEQWEEIGRRALLATSIIQSRNVDIASDSYVH